MIDIDARFEQMWDQYSERLLDRQQQALLRCWRDAPERLIGLFETYIEQAAARPVIPQRRRRIPPLQFRQCSHCGGPNYRDKAKHCYPCYRQRYLLQKRRRAA